MPADAAAVARDFALLSGRDRRAILAALDRDERTRLNAILRGGPGPTREPAGTRHSMWFSALAATARDPQSDGSTPAARAALLDALGNDETSARVPGRTLLQAAGGLLMGARAR